MTQKGVRVRHSSFPDCTGTATGATTKTARMGYETYPACFVTWDKPYLLDSIMCNYNLVFIVPAPSRKHGEPGK